MGVYGTGWAWISQDIGPGSGADEFINKLYDRLKSGNRENQVLRRGNAYTVYAVEDIVLLSNDWGFDQVALTCKHLIFILENFCETGYDQYAFDIEPEALGSDSLDLFRKLGGLMSPVDIYALAGHRSPNLAIQFLTKFAMNFTPDVTEFRIRTSWFKSELIHSVDEAISRLCSLPRRRQILCWKNPNAGTIREASLSFTSYRQMIAAIKIFHNSDSEVGYFLDKLGEVVGGHFSFATFEEAPPKSASQFRFKVEEILSPKWTRRLPEDV